MSAKIDVEQSAPDQFRVRVTEGNTETQHVVTMKASDYERISGRKVEPVELVRSAFEFLLARERKEQILARFDLTVISRYFAEFEQAMRRRLEKL
jgi:hypothetical protein